MTFPVVTPCMDEWAYWWSLLSISRARVRALVSEQAVFGGFGWLEVPNLAQSIYIGVFAMGQRIGTPGDPVADADLFYWRAWLDSLQI